MLRALDPAERRVLLAHERSHLRHRHHLHVQVADIAAAANPLLRPAARAVRFTVERWADEDAARASRVVAARSLARAGLAVAAARRTECAGALAATAVDVPERVAALMAAPPLRRRLAATVAGALILVAGAAAALATHETENRFEHAQQVYSAR
jgi:beta-lactamase regulating signal transducer with metallopeptidase domain